MREALGIFAVHIEKLARLQRDFERRIKRSTLDDTCLQNAVPGG